VSYLHKKHSVAYTSQEIAQVGRVSGEEFAKTVILKADEKLLMAVLPADHVIIMDKLKRHVGCETLALATEQEFIEKFPGCQPGAMPPFGKLFGLPLYCESALSKELEIEFNAGTHVDTIRMNFDGFNKLENPVLVSFSEKRTRQQVPRSA